MKFLIDADHVTGRCFFFVFENAIKKIEKIVNIYKNANEGGECNITDVFHIANDLECLMVASFSSMLYEHVIKAHEGKLRDIPWNHFHILQDFFAKVLKGGCVFAAGSFGLLLDGSRIEKGSEDAKDTEKLMRELLKGPANKNFNQMESPVRDVFLSIADQIIEEKFPLMITEGNNGIVRTIFAYIISLAVKPALLANKNGLDGNPNFENY